VKISAVVRVSSYLLKIYRVSQVDTQKIRAKLMHKLDSIFELAMAIKKKRDIKKQAHALQGQSY
jgi:hypothetical protein